MKYHFYINKKTGLVKMYDKTGKTKIDPDKFEIKSLDIKNDKILKSSGHKKIIKGKLTRIKSQTEIENEKFKEKLEKAKTITDLKKVIKENLK